MGIVLDAHILVAKIFFKSKEHMPNNKKLRKASKIVEGPPLHQGHISYSALVFCYLLKF